MWQSYVGHVIVQWQCMCWSCDSAVTVQWQYSDSHVLVMWQCMWQSCVGHVTVQWQLHIYTWVDSLLPHILVNIPPIPSYCSHPPSISPLLHLSLCLLLPFFPFHFSSPIFSLPLTLPLSTGQWCSHQPREAINNQENDETSQKCPQTHHWAAPERLRNPNRTVSPLLHKRITQTFRTSSSGL